MKIGFIGLGNMAQAMIGGVLRNHLAVPEEIYGSAKTAETESKVHEMFGITVTGDNLETARQAELLIPCRKAAVSGESDRTDQRH